MPQHSLVRGTCEKPRQARNPRKASPLSSLITAALSPSRRARLTILNAYRVKSFYGVGCQIRRQAGHGAAPNLATLLKAAWFILRLAAANAQIFFLKGKPPFRLPQHAVTHTDKMAIENESPLYAHVNPLVLRSHTSGRRPRTPG